MKLDAITTQPGETALLRPLRRSDAGLIEFYTKDERAAQTTTHPPRGRQKTFINRCLSVEGRGRLGH